MLEAAAIDAAWRRVHAAPDEPHFRPSPEEPARIGDCHLRPRSGWTAIDESWPLVELRRTLAGPRERARRGSPPALAAPQSWVLFRAPAGAAQLALLPRQAELFRLLARHRVADALARLESAAPPAERAQLSANVRVWLAQSVELGFWRGMDDSQVTFSEPVRLLETLTPTPANLGLAVDGAGSAWIAALDQSTVRVIQVPPGADPIEQVDAASDSRIAKIQSWLAAGAPND